MIVANAIWLIFERRSFARSPARSLPDLRCPALALLGRLLILSRVGLSKKGIKLSVAKPEGEGGKRGGGEGEGGEGWPMCSSQFGPSHAHLAA